MKNKVGKLNYLPGSVVFYGREPIFVDSISGNDLHFRYLKDGFEGDLFTKHIADKKFNFRAPCGGMTFSEEHNRTGMLVRSPRRNWKQGLSEHNTSVIMLGSYDVSWNINLRRDYKGLRLTLLNSYPVFQEAFEGASDKPYPVAFHKYFAIDKDKKLFYKNYFAGDYEGGNISMSDAFLALKEMCEEVIHVSR